MADIKIAGRIKAGAADNIAGYASEILFDDPASNKTVKEKIEEVASSPQTMIVTISPDGNDGYEADKTFAEIAAFIDNGGTVIAKDEEDGDSYYYLDNYIASEVVFTRNIWGSGGFSTRYYTIDNTDAVSFIDSVHHISSAVDSSSTANLANSAAVKAVKDDLANYVKKNTNDDSLVYFRNHNGKISIDGDGLIEIDPNEQGEAQGLGTVFIYGNVIIPETLTVDGKSVAVVDDIPDELADLAGDSTHRTVTDAEKSTWNGKQDALTFDDTPTVNSNNPVKSGGIKTALDAKQSTINTVNVTVDNNTGTPSGSASVSGSTLSLSFQNLKGATGATGATGPQGPQGERGLPGESGVTGDVSSFTVIQTIDPSATYGATDIAGAATVQATNAELTELAGELITRGEELFDINETTATASTSFNTPVVDTTAGTVTFTVKTKGNNIHAPRFTIPTLTTGTKYRLEFDYNNAINTCTVSIKDSGNTTNLYAFGNTFPTGTGHFQGDFIAPEGAALLAFNVNINVTVPKSLVISNISISPVTTIGDRISELASQSSLDELASETDARIKAIQGYEEIPWRVYSGSYYAFYIAGSGTNVRKWVARTNTYYFGCRIIELEADTSYRITANDSIPCRYALLSSNDAPVAGNIATTWNGGVPMILDAGTSVIIDTTSNLHYLYVRYDNGGSGSTYPKKVEKAYGIDYLADKQEAINDDIKSQTGLVDKVDLHVGEEGYEWVHGLVDVTNGNFITKDTVNAYCKEVPIDGSVYGAVTLKIASTSSGNRGGAFFDSNGNYLKDYSMINYGTTIPYITFVVPETAVKMRISNYTKATGEGFGYAWMHRRSTEVFTKKRWSIPMELGTGLSYFARTITDCINEQMDVQQCGRVASLELLFCIATNSGMIRLKNGNYTIISNVACNCGIALYDERRRCSFKTVVALSASGTEYAYTFNNAGMKYMRFSLFTDMPSGGTARPDFDAVPQVWIDGELDNDFMAKCDRTMTTAADKIMMPVWIENFDSTSATSIDTNQDSGSWKKDWGLIQLPDNYDPEGEPTRLVIYCHGGTPRYNPIYSGQSGIDYGNGEFTTTHLTPTYFLKEGYAVMDMDAVWCIEDSNLNRPSNPVKNCYLAGYEYVMRNYNLRKDGVLLAGKSYGASRVLYLMHTYLPVIAVGLEVPYVGPSAIWQISSTPTILRRSGFVDDANETMKTIEDNSPSNNWCSLANYPDGASWTALKSLLKDNYRAVLQASPLLTWCNIPNPDVLYEETGSGSSFQSFFRQSIGGSGVNDNISPWEENVFVNWSAKFPYPIKMWVGTNDDTADYMRHGYLMYKVGVNGGSNIEMRVLEGATADHSPSVPDSNVVKVSSWTTRYGETLSDVPLVYAEMINWFRRWEPLGA